MKQPSEESIVKKYSYMELPFFECESGWNKLISDLCKALAKIDKNKEIRVQQIKQKFAGLRFYIVNHNKKFHDTIAKYEIKSYKTCEECGAKGHKCYNIFGYYRTLCDKHQDEMEFIPCSRKKI